MTNEQWIDERKLKNKYEILFKELSKELYESLVVYKYGSDLDKLNYKLSAKLDWYKDKINEIKGDKLQGGKLK